MKHQEREIRESFIEQAEHCKALGSPFTARLCRLIAEHLTVDNPVGRNVFSWEGDFRPFADNVPLRLCGALNHLILTGSAPADLAAIYPPNSGWIEQGDTELWKRAETALCQCSNGIITFMKSPPQTNEVRRSAVLIPALLALHEHYRLPLRLYELGASAGLNLHCDRYRLNTGAKTFGPPNVTLVLESEWRGETPANRGGATVSVLERAGCDLAPIDIAADSQVTNLLSYVWPDQIDRVERTRLAIDTAKNAGDCRVEKADAIDWLEERLKAQSPECLPECLNVFFHTIVWQYFPDALKARGEKLFAEYGARATPQTPMARISMESDGRPDGAALKLTVWPNGTVHDLGRADFHGRWIDWKNPKL